MSEVSRILVGGGQDFYGPTAQRDRRVCELIPQLLFAQNPTWEIVTGGTAGIPDVFAQSNKSPQFFGVAPTHVDKLIDWPGAVLDVVSDEYEAEYKQRVGEKSARKYVLAGKSQLARRLAMTTMDGIGFAIFIQGGKFSTHELRLLHEKDSTHIVPLWGGGGAAGGEQSYEGWSLPKEVATSWNEPLLLDTDPATDPELIAQAIVGCIMPPLVKPQ